MTVVCIQIRLVPNLQPHEIIPQDCLPTFRYREAQICCIVKRYAEMPVNIHQRRNGAQHMQ